MQHKSETKRFILRPFRLSDLDDFFEMDADSEVHQFLGKNPVKSKEQLKKIIQGVIDQYQRNGIGRWAVEDKSTGEVVGWSGIKYEEEAMDFNYYDIGYRFKKQHWGKGIATETGMESVRYAFEEMKLNKICAGAETEHVVSNHILKKLGLKHTQTITIFGEQHHWYELKREHWMKENDALTS